MRWNGRKGLVLGLCALLLVSFTVVLAQKSFAKEPTLAGIVKAGKLVVGKKEYTLTGAKAAEATNLEGKLVFVTGKVDKQAMTIEVTRVV